MGLVEINCECHTLNATGPRKYWTGPKGKRVNLIELSDKHADFNSNVYSTSGFPLVILWLSDGLV